MQPRAVSPSWPTHGQDAGYTRCVASSLRVLAGVSYCKGDHQAARLFIGEALEACNALGQQREARRLRIALACLVPDDGDLGAARVLLAESLDTALKRHSQRNLAECLDAFACLAAACNQPERALRPAGVAEAMYARMGTLRWPVELLGWKRWLEPACGSLATEDAARAKAVGRVLTIEEAVVDALTISD